MKRGIKALLITLAIATTGMSAGALAVTPAAKPQATQSKSDAAAPVQGQTKATDVGKNTDDDGTRVSINSASAGDLRPGHEWRRPEKSAGYRQLPRRIWSFQNGRRSQTGSGNGERAG